MSEEKHIEESSVGIRRDASGNVIIAGKENTANVTIIMQTPPKEEQQKAVPINTLKPLSKMCNRNLQINEFIRHFQYNYKNYPGRPQIYLIHGDTGECHSSFIERIRHKELKKLWEYDIYYSNEMPDWPESGELKRRKQDLIGNLMNTFGDKIKEADISATDFSRLPRFDRRSLVIIRHDINAFKWDKRHETDLIVWYREYWSKLERNEKTPLFLIFLNIEYPKDSHLPLKQKMCFWSYCSPKNIENRLAEIVEMQNQNCPCSLISKLEPIENSHVRKWLKDYAEAFETEWEKIISEIFPGQTRSVSMNIVENRLLNFLKEQDKLVWK